MDHFGYKSQKGNSIIMQCKMCLPKEVKLHHIKMHGIANVGCQCTSKLGKGLYNVTRGFQLSGIHGGSRHRHNKE